MALIITFDGREYTFDKNAITIDEWRELKRKYHMTPKMFDDSIGQADPDASTFLYWVMLRQNGDQRVVLGDQLKFDIIALNNAVADAVTAEEDAEPEGEPDPTPAGSRPATTPSGGSATATSTSSTTSTSSPSPSTASSQPEMSDG